MFKSPRQKSRLEHISISTLGTNKSFFGEGGGWQYKNKKVRFIVFLLFVKLIWRKHFRNVNYNFTTMNLNPDQEISRLDSPE